jgi:23S rRNA pseudouridine2605 synthase
MRINKYIALSLQISRRKADQLIEAGEVKLNGQTATLGNNVLPKDTVEYKNRTLQPPLLDSTSRTIVLLNKPTGYLSSHKSQNAPTIFDLLPAKHQNLKIAGRLDKDSHGLIVLSNDGDFIHSLTHPKFKKDKIYRVKLSSPLNQKDLLTLTKGVQINEPSLSVFYDLKASADSKTLSLTLKEGRNRQIRRTLSALGYKVTDLQRIQLGPYKLSNLNQKTYLEL